jgi:hypothetical protein
MSVYSSEQEQAIRLRRLADEWMRSGFIDSAQHALIAADLKVDLRRTNRFLRVTLFAFGILIAGAATAFVAAILEHELVHGNIGVLCLVAAPVCVVAAEVRDQSLPCVSLRHRGSVLLVASVVFVALGCGLLVSFATGRTVRCSSR